MPKLPNRGILRVAAGGMRRELRIAKPAPVLHLDHPDLAGPQSVVVGQAEDGPVAGILNDPKQCVLLLWIQVLREALLPPLQPPIMRILSGSRAHRVVFHDTIRQPPDSFEINSFSAPVPAC